MRGGKLRLPWCIFAASKSVGGVLRAEFVGSNLSTLRPLRTRPRLGADEEEVTC